MIEVMDRVIEVAGLRKSFGQVNAVDGISFSIKQGELFGFLGPNGAGKTTTINMLTGLARPDGGTLRVAGHNCGKNPNAAQQVIGVVPDESNLYPELSGFGNLCFCAALYGMRKAERQSRARELLELFGLSDAAPRKFAEYSKGMKRKLTIAAGIIHRPPILFLDEPTTGIDVASARQIRQLIADLNRGGTTIFLTTHYIEEAERLCERIAFIVAGQIVRIDTVRNLLQPVQGRKVMLLSLAQPSPSLHRALASMFARLTIIPVTDIHIRIESDQPIRIAPVLRAIEEQGAEIVEARQLRPSLEDVFVSITGIEAGTLRSENEKRGQR
jgi:ABC-2 type transport system ATP-binding protein